MACCSRQISHFSLSTGCLRRIPGCAAIASNRFRWYNIVSAVSWSSEPPYNRVFLSVTGIIANTIDFPKGTGIGINESK